MTTAADAVVPRFSSTPYSILTTIGLNNVLLGFIVAGISGRFSTLVLVPIINSVAVCLVNGLWYYTYTADYATTNRAVACGFMNVAFLVQEAGLPFYNYIILESILSGRERKLFRLLFWVLMVIILAIKTAQSVHSVGDVLGSPAVSLANNNYLLLGYYISITLVECISAVFLLKNFQMVLRTAMASANRSGGLYRYIMRSTEIRLATMAFIGIGRTITTSVNLFGDKQKQGLATDIDWFIYTIECLFPIVMYIDILASRLIFASESNKTSHNLVRDGREGGSGQQQKRSATSSQHIERDQEIGNPAGSKIHCR